MGTRLPPDAELQSLYNQLGSVKAVAEKLGAPRTTVSNRIHRIGSQVKVDPRTVIDKLSHEVDERPIPVVVRDYSHLDCLYVYPLGDVHLGAKRHVSERWAEWLAYLIKNKNTSMLGTGDFLNTAIAGSPSDLYDETMSSGDAKRLLRRQLEPLAKQGRLDLLMPGNHEDRITKQIGDCPINDVCDSLDVPYTDAAAVVVYQVGGQEYDVFVRHGTGNGQSTAALKKAWNMVPTADVAVTGHVHAQMVAANEYYRREGGEMVRHRRYEVSSGSFLGSERYAIQRGYAPTRIGAPRIYLDGRSHDVHCSI
jgi:hypothetical protein